MNPRKAKASVGAEAEAEAVTPEAHIVSALGKQDKGFWQKALEGKVRPDRYRVPNTCGCACSTSRGCRDDA